MGHDDDDEEEDRETTVRRHLEQAKHCIEEALSIVMNDEDCRCAVDDVQQAMSLIKEAILPALRGDAESPKRRPR